MERTGGCCEQGSKIDHLGRRVGGATNSGGIAAKEQKMNVKTQIKAGDDSIWWGQ
jgi:hypothetical protein